MTIVIVQMNRKGLRLRERERERERDYLRTIAPGKTKARHTADVDPMN